MDQITAIEINDAALSVYLHMIGVQSTDITHVMAVNSWTVAQIQTASEYVEAQSRQEAGVIMTVVAPEAVEKLKEYAAKLLA